MAWLPIDDVFVPHTTTQVVVSTSGNRTMYIITPDDGYVIHDNRADFAADGIVNLEPVELFETGPISVGIDYDFTNKTQGTYNGADITKYGIYKLYAIPSDLLLHSNISPSVKKTTAQTEG